jgi:AraC-like DNA-binding protein
MSFFRFSCPPLLHYVVSGEDTYQPGRYHLSRKNLGVFDILIVTRGCLFMTEEASSWEVRAGEFLLLRPDAYHKATSPTTDTTHFYYLHVQTTGNWIEISSEEENDKSRQGELNRSWSSLESTYHYQKRLNIVEKDIEPFSIPFVIDIPRYGKLSFPAFYYDNIQKLIDFEKKSQMSVRFRQQVIFLNILQDLQNSKFIQTPAIQLAESVASYLRENYDKVIKYSDIEKAFNYNSTYISRCMIKTFGISSNKYLNNYRIEKAIFLLANSDFLISEIAEKVGFQRLSYFTRCFKSIVGILPKEYRKKFRI